MHEGHRGVLLRRRLRAASLRECRVDAGDVVQDQIIVGAAK